MQAILAIAGTLEMHASTDGGITWAQKTHPMSGYAGKVAFGGGVWLYVQSNEPANVAYVSGDLEEWTLVTLPAIKTWKHLRFMLGKFYLFSTSTDYYRSADGVTWTAHTAPIASTTYALVDASESLILLVATYYTTTTNIYSSSDGVTWSLAGVHTVPTDSSRRGLYWTGGSFSIYQSGGSSPSLDKSIDGASWAGTTTPSSRSYYGADATIGCAAQGSSSTAFVWNGDSASFATSTSLLSASLVGVSVIAGRILLMRSGALEYSDDGETWTTAAYSFGDNIQALIGGELSVEPIMLSTLMLSNTLDGKIMLEASSLDELTLSSTVSLTLLLSETYFDSLMLSDLMQSSQTLSADLTSVLRISTDIGSVLVVDGGRVVLGEPIQYGVNAATGALTRYQNFGFDGYARCGQTLYGAKPGGVYRIVPGSDNGEPIQVMVDFGDTDLGTASGKVLESVYLGIDTDGAAYVRLQSGGTDRTYRAIQKGEMARAVPGKGMAGRRWNISLEIADATKLTLDMVEIKLGTSARRLRGRS